ncbi:segregation and condensation protein B [Desulfitispora alkaliphila]
MTVMFKEENKAILEALLFVASNPVKLEELSKIVSLTQEDTGELLGELKAEYQQSCRGFQLMESGDGFYLASKTRYAPYIQKLLQDNNSNRLSKASLETLAIVAYKQPITRSEIEAIRGVKSEKAITTLLEKELIKEVGRKDGPGKPILYGTTKGFLNNFGLNHISELPQIEDFEESIKNIHDEDKITNF